MFHMSDWLPTLLAYANISSDKLPPRLDGLDFSQALRTAEFEDTASIAHICTSEGQWVFLDFFYCSSRIAAIK